MRCRLVLLLLVWSSSAQPDPAPLEKEAVAAAAAEASRKGISESEAAAALDAMRREDPERYALTALWLLTNGNAWKCYKGSRNWLSDKPIQRTFSR